MNTGAVDPGKLQRYCFTVWNFKQREMVSLMVHLGDRLGLYRALSEPVGAGLGTLGFYPPVAETMACDGGLSRFQCHDLDDPSNLYCELRP